VPVWGVWLDDAFYFSSGAKSRKARNLAANPNCVVCPKTDPGGFARGVAEKISDMETIRRIVEAYIPSTSGT